MLLNWVNLSFLVLSVTMLSMERFAWINGLTASAFQIVGFGLFIFHIKLIYNKNSKYILASFYQIFYFSGMLLSALFLSFGVPMIEIGEIGDSNGTFWVLLIFFVVGSYFSMQSFEAGVSSKLAMSAPRFSIGVEKKISLILASIPLIFSAVVFVRYGLPATSGERTIFWNQVVPPYLSWVNSSLKQMFFFVSLILVVPSLKSKILPWIFLIAYILLAVFLLGEKASGFIVLISIFLITYGAVTSYRKIGIRVYLWSGIVGISILYLIIYNYRESNYGYGFVLTRIALQAQVLWATLNVDSFPYVQSESIENIQNIFTAADYLTYKFLPNYLYEIYTESGSTLSGFLPAFPIIYFGFFGALVAHSVVSAGMGFVAGLITSAIKSRSYIFAFLLLKIYLAVIFSWFALIFSAIFGVAFFICVYLIFIAYLTVPLRTQKRCVV